MPINTVSVATAVTPTVIETYISHYLRRQPLRQKPTAHITYHEGLELIRRFLYYASFHTVEDIQAFTSQWVPVPHWVHVKEVTISQEHLLESAQHLHCQLGPEGIKEVGGKTWWQWRRSEAALKAEWIEMRKDHDARKKSGSSKGSRIMLYVHGGAYYFGSVDEHRYQMQRHARKLKARVLAPKYRLAPQFPFPCGIQDCLASYLYLLAEGHDPSTIILAGDSAGGGMVLSMLIVLRDQGVQLPAGAILISPWVDLTHSFPSLGGDGKWDYIPAHGFVHKPSLSWPPPNADDLLASERPLNAPSEPASDGPSKEEQKAERTDRVRGFSLRSAEAPDGEALSEALDRVQRDDVYVSQDGAYSIGPRSMLSLKLGDSLVEIKDQIQLYAANHLITHPLVSPVLQPSLGGLPPLLIQVGGGELLRDEQIYLAHKAAAPLAHLPPPSNHQTPQTIEAEAARYRPTNVQLQVWDDLCHVAPTLSFTRPAKYMYRSIAQFGAWALARAQKTAIYIMDDDEVSVISSSSSISSSESDSKLSPEDIKLSMPSSAQHVDFETLSKKESKPKSPAVGKAGDPLPPFQKHMIRQRIDRHGFIHPLAEPSQLQALNVPTAEIGVPKTGPVYKWMKAQQQWNSKYAKQKLKVQKRRLDNMQKGYEGFEGESPPPTALAGRRVKGMKAEKKKKKSWGMMMWSGWGSKHDEMTIEREEKADQDNPSDRSRIVEQNQDNAVEEPAYLPFQEQTASKPPKARLRSLSRTHRATLAPGDGVTRSRSRSRHSSVTDRGQISPSMENLSLLAPPNPDLAEATMIAPERSASPLPSSVSPTSAAGLTAPEMKGDVISRSQSPETLIPNSNTSSTRPFRGGVAYPFRLQVNDPSGSEVNASTVTLHSFNVAGPGVDTEEIEMSSPHEESDDHQRPTIERFVTAGVGSANWNENNDQAVGAERPGVERFETAHEELPTIVDGKN